MYWNIAHRFENIVRVDIILLIIIKLEFINRLVSYGVSASTHKIYEHFFLLLLYSFSDISSNVSKQDSCRIAVQLSPLCLKCIHQHCQNIITTYESQGAMKILQYLLKWVLQFFNQWKYWKAQRNKYFFPVFYIVSFL